MTTESEAKHHFGYFQAKYLPPLHNFVKYGREVFYRHPSYCCIHIHPAEIGGIYIVAATGHATAIIHDPEGRADDALTLDIPDAAFVAAKGPQVPPYTFWGDDYEITPPEWMQPGMAYVYSTGMHISPKMRNPAWANADNEFYPSMFATGHSSREYHVTGKDFSLTSGTPLAWRSLLEVANNAGFVHGTETESYFNPEVPALFNPLIDLLTKEHPKAVPVHSPRVAPKSDATMHILQLTDCPEFVGVWMGMKPATMPELPAHFYSPASESAATKQAAE